MRYSSSIISSSIGNILEWYDFGLFTIFSALFSQLFFPGDDPKVAMVATVGIFAVGFLCRPIGALIFGYLGDKTGRAKTLRLSILMIALPTFFIGFIPTYEEIGILAPILLMLIRIWQGISIGGEYSGNIIYLAETSPKTYRATFTSLASTGANIGILLAALVGIASTTLMPTHILTDWGWRLPYLISGIFCLLIYLFRLRIHESLVFEYLKNHHKIARNPIQIAFEKNYLEILRTFGLVCMGSTFYYFCFIYLPIFLKQNLGFSMFVISTIMSILITCMIMLIPLMGFLCDQIGRRKMMLLTSILITLGVVPGFYLLHVDKTWLIILVLSLFTLASSLEQGSTSITIVENFPPPARYTGLSLGYNLGNGLLGGTVPIICEWLTSMTSFMLAPAIYIALAAATTGFVVYFFVPETKGKSLT